MNPPTATNNGMEIDPWGDDLEGGQDNPNAAWRERERRQQTVRFLMMFLLMLLLMDGEEQQQRKKEEGLYRKRRKASQGLPLHVYEARQAQDGRFHHLLEQDPRYLHLIERNNKQNVDSDTIKWAFAQLELEKDEFVQDGAQETSDPEEDKKVMHYPWNATGFYRGEWAREEQDHNSSSTNDSSTTTSNKEAERGVDDKKERSEKKPVSIKTVAQVELPMLEILKEHHESVGVYLLPEGLELQLPNVTDPEAEAAKKAQSRQSPFLRAADYNLITTKEPNTNPHITLTKTSGRAAFQLYSRTVPAIQELSLLDGFVKLYDSNTVGYSTRRDILLRVSGVLIHSVGRISLVSNAAPGRSALVIGGDATIDAGRRLLEAVASFSADDDLEQIREDAMALYPLEESLDENEGPRGSGWTLTSFNFDADDIGGEDSRRRLDAVQEPVVETGERKVVPKEKSSATATVVEETTPEKPIQVVTKEATPFSKFVVPYPFVPDDNDQTVRKTKTPAVRRMPPREQLLEANAGSCEFEINMNVQEEEWTVGQWRKLVGRHVKETLQLNPALSNQAREGDAKTEDSGSVKKSSSSKSRKPIQDQALVMIMNGTITSPNCDFTAGLNATAIRTDWEHTTGKAINYSFYMMLTCLTQIVVLLRQLLHTQSQSSVIRVSLLCIGWQTVLDALLCLIHIYLSLAMQPLFTAFASVAFFKLLIFCVIEMKYMAIIIQARNASNGGNTVELLRRQIAMLHLRFYVALISSFLAFFYAGETYRTLYVLGLYSFWVPQIVQNVCTEAKRPLHPYYIYGMSLTRLVAPLYMFAVPNNFLKEVYPDSPTNVFMCQLLVLWVGFQTLVLVAQGRYGTRFMIPARFLPPKFDYNRPLPASLYPPGSPPLEVTPSESLQNERASATTEVQPLVPKETISPHRTNGVTRNRKKDCSKVHRAESMTTETVTPVPTDPSLPSFDCVICYNSIDVCNRRGYMLAPCDHLFHKDCLIQWMDVKMECPICRTQLPAL
jgi:hypothetical protein